MSVTNRYADQTTCVDNVMMAYYLAQMFIFVFKSLFIYRNDIQDLP